MNRPRHFSSIIPVLVISFSVGLGGAFAQTTTTTATTTPPQGCGDGVVDPGEACDNGSANGFGCCTSSCQFASSATPCRTLSPLPGCDLPGFCTGSSAD